MVGDLMKLNTKKTEMKLTKAEKGKLKTTARKEFVKDAVKEGIHKTENDGTIAMYYGAAGTVWTAKQTARKAVQTVKAGKHTVLTVKQIIEFLKQYDKKHPGKEILKGLSSADQEKLAGEVLKKIKKDEMIKSALVSDWMEKNGKKTAVKVSPKASIPVKSVSLAKKKITKGTSKAGGLGNSSGLLKRMQSISSKAYGFADRKVEKKVINLSKNIRKKGYYNRKAAGLNLLKSSIFYTAGDQEEKGNIARSAATIVLGKIFEGIKIKIVAAIGWILPFLIPLFIPILVLMLIVVAGSVFHSTQNQNAALSAEVEAWRPTVEKYCSKYGIGDYTDLALALMMQESGGAEPDPMQAAEGGYGLYCLKTKNNSGGHSHSSGGIPKGHGECSINAGVQELRDALKAAKVKDPYDIGRIMVALQGYNYGMSGWIKWINRHGGIYTLALSQEYSRTMMPAGRKGTPEHAQLVMRYYSYNDVGATTTVSGNGGVSVVYYSQADPRWGNIDFGGNTIQAAGCGPTSMAICISTLDKKVSPVTTCKWSAKAGYYVKGQGWSHSVIPGLAKHYKLKCTGIGKNKTALIKALKEKKLVVAIMGPGEFTDRGHYIVLRGMTKSGKILVADCGNRARNKAYPFDTVFQQVKSADAGGPFWVITK